MSSCAPLEICKLKSSRRPPKGGLSLTGFTLVELLLVIFVVVLLASVAAPAYNKTLDEAYRRDAKSMLNVIRGAEMVYMSTYNTYTAFSSLDDSVREKLLMNVYDTQHWEYSVGVSGLSATATAIRQAGKHKDNVITIDVGTGTIVQDYSW